MPSHSTAQMDGSDPMMTIQNTLCRMAAASLHMQARAVLHESQPDLTFTGAATPIAKAATKAQTDLRAMSRFCLQNLLTRSQSLMVQIDSVAEAANAPMTTAAPAGRLNAIAAELDRCCTILRGHSRSSPRGADMLRWSEQRLWGGIAAELHRLEGTDGPIMQACARIEVIAFDLASTTEILMECGGNDLPDALSLAMRRDLAIRLIAAATGIGHHGYDPARLRSFAKSAAPLLQDAAQQIEALIQEFLFLRTASQQIASAVCVAAQVSALSMATTRLEHDIQELDLQLSELATTYRALAANTRLGDKALARIVQDAAEWRAAALAVVDPLALSNQPLTPVLLQGIVAGTIKGTDQRIPLTP